MLCMTTAAELPLRSLLRSGIIDDDDGCRWIVHLLLVLPDEQLLRIITLAIFPADFDVAAAAHVLGQSACPTKTSSLLRELHRMGLAEVACTRGRWRLHAAVRDAGIALAAKLQLPLIAARCIIHTMQCNRGVSTSR